MKHLCLGADELGLVFPFHFVLDGDARIVGAGPGLRRLLPGIGAGEPLGQAFAIELPATTPDIAALREHSRGMFKLRSRTRDKLMLKGQILPLPHADATVFLGSPWSTTNADFIALGLSLRDFALHDSVPDFLLQTYSLKHSLADAQALTERLAALNRDLERRVAERTQEVVATNEALLRSNGELEREIAERKAAQEKVQQMAYFDPLTGLANRALLHDRLNQALAARRRDARLLAVMFIDLDRFKPINDSFGHHVGDALLKAVAERLSGFVRESDTVSRLGGDEFIVVLPEIGSRDDALYVARKVVDGLAAPYHIASHRLETTPSIGISVFPEDGDDGDVLIRNADSAMYSAKSGGRNNFRFFAPRAHSSAA